MLTVRIDPSDARPMVEQIVDGIRRLVDERRLRPGTRLPSIRQFAEYPRRQPLHRWSG